MKKISFAICLLFLFSNLSAAEWQWSIEIKSMVSDETNNHPRAFLWIPADCKQVRGIVVGMHNMTEEGIFEHETFRKALSEIGFAEIWVTPGIDPLFDVTKGAQTAFDEMLNTLSEVSGYSELRYAPVVPIGHSAYATYPWNFAAWNPEKTVALLSVHGDAPQTNLTGCGRPNLDWGNRTTDGIPGLMVMGEYEWWEDRLTPVFAYKNTHPKSPVSLLGDAGHGHFDHSDSLVKYLALFVKKAAHYRLENICHSGLDPESLAKPVKLKPIDPASGWLADRWHPDQTPPKAKAAPYNQYKGDKSNAFWYFDEEMARETEKFYAAARGKKEQYIGFLQNNELLTFNEESHARIHAKFEPENDGLTFHLSAAFTDTLRRKLVSDHSNQGTITIDRICGPVEKVNDTTFTVRFYRMGLNSQRRTGDIWLIARHDGDNRYKSAVQQLNLRIPHRNTEGKEQHILFSPLPNVNQNVKSITLHATADSGLPVYYYVKEGPAEISGNELIFTAIPPGTKFPVKVTVVAWQYGRSTGEKVQTADAVENSFYIEPHASDSRPVETIIENTRTRLASPDGKQTFEFYQKKNEIDGTLVQYYKTNYEDQPVVLESKLDIQLDNHIWERALAKFWKQPKNWNDLMVFDKVETASHNEIWKPLYGERSEINDNYNAATIHFSRRDNSGYKMNIEVRAYNEGIAFRYSFPMHPEAIYHKVTAENTEFTMPEGTTAWWTQWAQAPYYEKPLKDWEDESERPLTLKLSDNLYACITEAQQIDFPKIAFKLSKDKKNTIQTSLYGSSDMVTPFGTPWRVIMASHRLGQLLENNTVLLNLNDANKIVDANWIKPGKIMRETTLTTVNAKACIDFCVQHNMQYILFDWKWYGPSFDFHSDASQVVISELDMKEVVAFGKSKGIGVWLYVNQHALQHQADKIFPVYKEWGIAGVKFGFVEFKTQGWATWVHELVKKAADNHLMVNIHDEYRPTGYSRTYPNLLSQEGIRGNEEFPDATHNTMLPFTRMIAGAADYTVCYFDPRIQNTHAHQLALPVIFYSPLQTLYWYDTPARIEAVPELEFFDKVPVSWDETKVINDKIGEYVTIARRSNSDWFVGTIGNNEAQQVSIPLRFLEPGKKYVARIYTDDDKIQTSTRVKITSRPVDSTAVLSFSLKEKGGCVIHLTIL
ncbi:hypothetical protein FACS1894145_5300 [Bacteroidia bacterium]|nr:hypothetical protein FACS1894145_5300 [Bacteroidia bacterium]